MFDRPSTNLCTNQGISALDLPQFGTKDVSAVSIDYKKADRMQALVVASVYLPIDTAPPTKELEQLVTHCENKNLPLVIACDSNSHHTAWGSSECNARGIQLLEYLATTGLEIANTGAEPTFVAGNKRTVIDITLASGSLMQDIHACEVSKEDTMSDHQRINCLLEQNKPASRYCRNPRRTN